MTEFLIIVLIIGILCIVAAAICIGSYIIFEHLPRLTGKIGATLKDTKHKKNVTYHTRSGKVFVKDLTKGLYAYTVNGKIYPVKMTHFDCTKNQAPYMIPIVYIKRFPRICYINLLGSFSLTLYLIYGIIFGFTGLSLLFISANTFF